jgi:GTP cyclohydrolase I
MVKFAENQADFKVSSDNSTDVSNRGIDAEESVNGSKSHNSTDVEGHKKKRKHKEKKPREDGKRPIKKRRHSISKAARDPRDEASPLEPEPGTRSPSPVIDFDGLSKPSTSIPSLPIGGTDSI